MGKGDLIFVKHNKWIHGLIRKAINCPYNHVGVFEDSTTIIEANFSGVEKTPFSSYIKAVENREVEFAICKLNATDEQKSKIVEFMQGELGSKYDFLQFLSLIFFLACKITLKTEPIDITNKWLCSELIAEAANNAGLSFNENVDPDNITPAHIYNSKLVEKKV